jgi:hypothetical protein
MKDPMDIGAFLIALIVTVCIIAGSCSRFGC